MRLDEPLAVGERHRLRAAVYVQLAEDALDVRADRRRADLQRARDVFLVQAAREQPQDLALAGRELGERVGAPA